MLTDPELERYKRQMLLFGEEGQQTLKDASVLIAGAGGLGSPVAYYLAAAGVGHIRIVDNDTVEESNLNRQILHWETDIGKQKVDSAQRKLASLNPDVVIDACFETINEESIMSLSDGVDVIIDAVDNYDARYLLNREAINRQVPFFHGAISGFQGQVVTVIPGKTACLRCLFPIPPPKEVFAAVGVTAGIIGVIQANEVLKYLLGAGNLLLNKLILWDGLSCTLSELPVTHNPCCVDCSGMRDKR